MFYDSIIMEHVHSVIPAWVFTFFPIVSPITFIMALIANTAIAVPNRLIRFCGRIDWDGASLLWVTVVDKFLTFSEKQVKF